MEHRKWQDFTFFTVVLPELQNVICYIGAEQEKTSLAERLHLTGGDDCWTSGSKERREHSKKAKSPQADKQRPIDSTAKLFWFSQLMAGERLRTLKAEDEAPAETALGLLIMAEKHPSATPPSAPTKQRKATTSLC